MKSISRGLLAVNIMPNTLCPHSFIVYIDKNLKIRDYFMADFQIDLPEMALIKKLDESKITSLGLINIDLIKLNLPAIIQSFILRGMFYKQKMVLVFEENFINMHIINFFNYITQDTFELNISIISQEKYKENKKIFKDYLVLDERNVIHDKNKIINPKKMPVERRIIHQFILENNLDLSLIMLKNEIHKAYEMSKFIVDYLEKEEDKKKKIDLSKIRDALHGEYNIEISSVYLNFLFQVVENYFEINLPSSLKIVLKTIF
jgi:hypothetical protein